MTQVVYLQRVATLYNVMVTVRPHSCVKLVVGGCCWWESSGVVDISSCVWTGRIQQVNFIGDEIGATEFLCVDLSKTVVDRLWSLLPDEPELLQELLPLPTGMPTLPHPLALLYESGCELAPPWGKFCVPQVLTMGEGTLVI